jgi:hypothetical protein
MATAGRSARSVRRPLFSQELDELAPGLDGNPLRSAVGWSRTTLWVLSTFTSAVLQVPAGTQPLAPLNQP